MPPQSRTTHGFAGDAVEIDLIHKGIKTRRAFQPFLDVAFIKVEIDLIHKGIKTRRCGHLTFSRPAIVEIDLIHKGIKTYYTSFG